MNREKWIPIVNISLPQIGIAILSVGAIAFTIILEVPQRNFPKTQLFFSDVPIDYWHDIFLPAISIPLFIQLIAIGLNILGLLLAYWMAKRRHHLWAIGVLIVTLIDLTLVWTSILWVHGALGCISDNLRYGHIFGCVYNFQPEVWHIITGVFFSILIIVSQILWCRRLFMIILKK